MFIETGFIDTQKIDKRIIDMLDEDQANEDFILDKFQQLETYGYETIYVKLLKILTHLEFPMDEAKKIWKEVHQNKKALSDKVGRDIGFRVALLDYFINLNKQIKNPKIIEIKLYVEAEKLVLLDELTGLYNRRYFQHCLEREIKQATRHRRDLSLIIFDIDDFKSINDTFGHIKGDWVLEKLGEIMNHLTRIEDSACRIGGEEFALIMPETSADNAFKVGNKIREAFSKLSLGERRLSISGGVASYPEDTDQGQQLVEIADKLLYFAKYSGKDRILTAAQEKRSELRFPAHWKLTYNIIDKKFETFSNDLSIVGASFEIEENLAIGDIISLIINNSQDPNDMCMRAQIIWKEKIPESKKFRVGAKFLETHNSFLHQMKKGLEVI